jgi:hypothetical protein
MFPPPKDLQTASSGADAHLSAREPEDPQVEDPHSAAPGVASAGRERSAEEIFAQWAVAGRDSRGHVRYLVGRHLHEAPSDRPLSSVAPLDEQAPCTHLTWNRLQRSGVGALIDDWCAEADALPPFKNAESARRLCQLIDRVIKDDPTAALVAVHAACQNGASLAQRLEKFETVLQFAREVPEPLQLDRRPGHAKAASAEAGQRHASAHDAGSAEVGPETTPSIGGDLLVEALGPRALRPQVSLLSQSSVVSSNLPSLELTTEVTIVTPSVGPMPTPSLSLPGGGAMLEVPIGGAGHSPTPSVHSQSWRWPHWEDADTEASGSSLPSTPSLPSLASLAWLPSMRTTTDGSQSPLSDDFMHPGEEDLKASQQILSFPTCPGLSKADELQRQWALTLISSYLDGSRDLLFLSPDESASIAWIIASMVRKTMSLNPARSDKKDISRSPEASNALNTLARWVGEADGVEGVRRERWLQYLTDRSFDPECRLLLAAPLLAHGADLPPRDALDTLLPPDSLSDRGTLRWKGEPLCDEASLAELLDRLGVRHLEVAAPLQLSTTALQPLRGADVLAVSLRKTRAMSSSSLKECIAKLEATLPALYEVRLMDRRTTIDRDATPDGWIPDPRVAGQLRHARRDANRKRMAPVRDLWPQGRMPPALRASAVNVLPDGEPVLEFIGSLRRQRAATGLFGATDIELSAHLIGVLDGLARDADFARRCRALAEDRAGPCADGGTLTLSAMSALRDASEATSIDEVAEDAFLQACLARASAARAERRPDFDETLEEAMVLRWHVSMLLADLLDSQRIRIADKPVFGAYVEGGDWNSPERHATFRAEAMALVAAETEGDFPGVVMLMSAQEDPLAATFQSRIDREPGFTEFDQARAAAQGAYGADSDAEDDAAALARTEGELHRIDQAHFAARLATLRPRLEGIAAVVRAALPAMPTPTATA